MGIHFERRSDGAKVVVVIQVEQQQYEEVGFCSGCSSFFSRGELDHEGKKTRIGSVGNEYVRNVPVSEKTILRISQDGF